MMQIAFRAWRRSGWGNLIRPRLQTFVLWQFKKIWGWSADLIYNVDTFRCDPDALRERAGRYAYDPTPWSAFRRIFTHFRLDFARYTFIDMGAGKGRIVLAASAFPFIGVIGVEFSPSLCRIAESNLLTCRFLRRRASMTRIVECDAAEFQIPGTACAFFFYNPFNNETMNRVINNIILSYQQSRREVYLICVGMSTIFLQMVRNSNLELRHSFDIRWGMFDHRSVYIFMITDD